jgi:menaquinone-dependent protoporphyrinogen IX oxidase
MGVVNRLNFIGVLDLNSLLVYGTRSGGTVKVAQTIGKTYTMRTSQLRLSIKKNYENLSSCDFLIVGRGMQADKWTKESEILGKKRDSLQEQKLCSL